MSGNRRGPLCRKVVSSCLSLPPSLPSPPPSLSLFLSLCMRLPHYSLQLFIHIHVYRGHQFRREFSWTSEIRALAPPTTNLMALTATATYETRNKIIKALEMDDCKVVAMIPNNLNIYYAVLPLPPSPMGVLSALIEEICSRGRDAKRTIVFCRSYDNLIELYTTAVLEIGKRGKYYIEGADPDDCRICDKYDACTALDIIRSA